jgi:hypothetical protein
MSVPATMLAPCPRLVMSSLVNVNANLVLEDANVTNVNKIIMEIHKLNVLLAIVIPKDHNLSSVIILRAIVSVLKV